MRAGRVRQRSGQDRPPGRHRDIRRAAPTRRHSQPVAGKRAPADGFSQQNHASHQ